MLKKKKKTSFKFIIKRRRSGWGVGTERIKGRNWEEKKGEKIAARM